MRLIRIAILELNHRPFANMPETKKQRCGESLPAETMKKMPLGEAEAYRQFGLHTIRYPVVEITATVTPLENHCGSMNLARISGQKESSLRKSQLTCLKSVLTSMPSSGETP